MGFVEAILPVLLLLAAVGFVVKFGGQILVEVARGLLRLFRGG